MTDAVHHVFGDAVDADGDDGSLVEYDVGNLYAFDPTPFDTKVRRAPGLHPAGVIGL
jgi:hypothetical protein